MGSVKVLKIVLTCLVVDACLSSSIKGSGPANQTCGPIDYYCPAENVCKAGVLRCTDNETCNYGSQSDGCYKTNTGAYTVQVGHAILLHGSLFKRSNVDLEHRFIQYRGYTYEYGKSYGIQVLDINDPRYKYKNGKNINKKGFDDAGESYCTYGDILIFLNGARKKYNKESYRLISNNCQYFASALKEYLTMKPCTQQPQTLQNQLRTQQLQSNVDKILMTCKLGSSNVAGISSSLGIIISFPFIAYFI